MTYRIILLGSAILIATAVAAEPTFLDIKTTNADGICAASIPDGYDWPRSAEDMYAISGGLKTSDQTLPGVIDTASQRKHGWLLFAGVTQPATGSPKSLPVFMTWYTVEEAFEGADEKIDCATRHPVLQITAPTQMLIGDLNPIAERLEQEGITVSPRFDPDPALVRDPSFSPEEDAHGVTAFSHVAFNQELYDFIRDNAYYKRATLDALIDPSEARLPINDPPLRGVSLKFSWWPADPKKLTPVPVWDDNPRFPGDEKNPPETWTRVVLVDPVGGQPAPAKVILGKYEHANPMVVGLDRFFAVKISAEEATLANSDFRIRNAAKVVLGRELQAGDFLLMTAMHIATREFDPWVFTTYWWSDQADAAPLGNDRPQDVKGPFRNYVMDVSYNINRPLGPDGRAPVSMNPWLELFQRGGTRSQCMACHARAAYGPKVKAGFNPADMSTADSNGFEGTPTDASDPAYQKGTVSLHRIWTIFTRAR